MTILYKLIRKIGRFFSRIVNTLRSLWYKKIFREMKGSIRGFEQLEGAQYISIGCRSIIHKGCILTAWDCYENDRFDPSIEIGSDTRVGEKCQISACNKIVVGNGVLIGRRVYISDNAHGKFEENQLRMQPVKRPLYSKGPVIIEDNVWIGERACILAGVKIGNGAIVAANAVVTHDVPAFSLVAGVPAKVIKKL